MTKNKGIITFVGFLLAGTGFLALVLSLVGVQLSFLTWIDSPGRLFGFVVRLLMILVGIVIVYLAQTDFSGEN
jgi:predicted transcriptional regulator